MNNFHNKLVSIFALVMMFTLLSCCDQKNTPNIVKYPRVERVFMHDPGEYSFLYKDESSGQLISINKNIFKAKAYSAKYVLIPDVNNDDFCWAEVDMNNSIITIHIHDSSEIAGGGWNHGKFGSGSTTPIE